MLKQSIVAIPGSGDMAKNSLIQETPTCLWGHLRTALCLGKPKPARNLNYAIYPFGNVETYDGKNDQASGDYKLDETVSLDSKIKDKQRGMAHMASCGF